MARKHRGWGSLQSDGPSAAEGTPPIPPAGASGLQTVRVDAAEAALSVVTRHGRPSDAVQSGDGKSPAAGKKLAA